MKTTHMLATLIAAALLGLVAMGVIGHLGQRDLLASLEDQNASALSLRHHMQADMMHDALRGDVLAAMLAGRQDDTAGVASARQAWQEHAATFREAIAANAQAKLHLDAATARTMQEIGPALDGYIGHAGTVIGQVEEGAATVDRTYADFIASFEDLETRMAAISDGITVADRVAHAEADTRAAGVARRQWLSAVLAILALSALGGWIARALRRQLGGEPADVADIARRIAAGDFSRSVALRDGDRGSLAHSMQQVQEQVQAVIVAQRHMAERHEQGTISYRMDEAAFPGDYGRMVHDTNALVAAHVDMKMRLVDLMQRYAIGDLSADMDRLPGEKAVITEAMDMCKANLSAINGDIKRLAAAAAEGDFSQRGDVAQYRHDFREMVASVNSLMESTHDNLGEVSALLQAIARGDLTARMEGDFHGVFATMRDDANATVAQLTDIVGRIQDASGSINTAAGEIASGNLDLSRRTEQQAANLEETAASMEELTSTVRQNAESAREANQLAMGAASVASQGGDVVGKVVATMSDIQQSSRRIADIISVIDGIAFQTNILALNAAVEAARAGEQGRGFAVVASEVRTLAQRSANAAKEIKGLIETSVDKVAEGSTLVDQAGTTMSEIVSSVQRVTDIMAEISAASQEQSAGIEQVNQTITHMDEATQQNAALVEEASAAATSMAEQARALAESVAVFTLDTRISAPVRHAIAAATHGKDTPAAPAAKPKAVARKPAPGKTDPTFANDSEWQEF
ncbi:methyl-accepting chemotaxis protein [Pseudoxanthomonas japonensis]|jgi:methyl-accepting chemotaxis protein|uniref:methyl-accepting chemotaxis protein n=1 Tax=Pseudoxanthomonas japonensis TaxID=69284 RepID=UPI0020BF7C62|nr:methyl-accepting chemotaxis protein [Pseudoxanthomonas japonensis]